MMSKIPYEIIHQILLYHGDIDMRRNFGLYGPIDKEKFSILNTIMRTPSPIHRRLINDYLYQQYALPNIHNFNERTTEKIKDDYLIMKVAPYEGKVYYNFGIYRLKPTPFYSYPKKEFPCDNKTVDDYRWLYVTYSFILNH